MECDEVRRLLDSYLDNEFELTRNLELEDHLTTCSECGATAETAIQFNSVVRTMISV
jgi:anti-sigma factor RsiW